MTLDIQGYGSLELRTYMSGSGADWIYAASMNLSDDTFLGCYSGRIFKLSSQGDVIALWDAKYPIEALTPMGGVLLVETGTTVFSVSKQALKGEAEVWGRERVTYFPKGFVVEKRKQMQIYNMHAVPLGEISTQDSIRGYWRAGEDLVLETNKAIAYVRGVFRSTRNRKQDPTSIAEDEQFSNIDGGRSGVN